MTDKISLVHSLIFILRSPPKNGRGLAQYHTIIAEALRKVGVEEFRIYNSTYMSGNYGELLFTVRLKKNPHTAKYVIEEAMSDFLVEPKEELWR